MFRVVFVFDCSSAHEAFGPNVLCANTRELRPGGQQKKIQDTVIPSNNPEIPTHLQGLPQLIEFPLNHPDQALAGQPKGIRIVLEEQVLWSE